VSVESLVGEDGDVLYERRFQALLAANLLAPLGITLVSPLLDTLSGPFGVSTARLGLLVSAYTAPPILLIPVAGILADRVGRKPVPSRGSSSSASGARASRSPRTSGSRWRSVSCRASPSPA
jgi:MFS family permease